MPTITEYSFDHVKACLTVLLELLTYLKPYESQIVLIGGWAPYFLTQRNNGDSPHQGSLDIDVAVNPASIPDKARNAVTLRIANLIACFTMKATTFHNRGREKDAYDLYVLVKEYSHGIDAVVAELSNHRENKLVKEALDSAA